MLAGSTRASRRYRGRERTYVPQDLKSSLPWTPWVTEVSLKPKRPVAGAVWNTLKTSSKVTATRPKLLATLSFRFPATAFWQAHIAAPEFLHSCHRAVAVRKVASYEGRKESDWVGPLRRRPASSFLPCTVQWLLMRLQLLRCTPLIIPRPPLPPTLEGDGNA